jgi:hypothetical protein
MYNVHQHWDPLKVCIVGKSYAPEFYSFIANSKVRNVLERIAIETEEDYQKLINLLKRFGVTVLRPNVHSDYKFYLDRGKILPPPMTPRDYSMMLGSDFYFKPRHIYRTILSEWDRLKGMNWPDNCPSEDKINQLPAFIKKELCNFLSIADIELNHWELNPVQEYTWRHVLNQIQPHVNKIVTATDTIYLHGLNAAESTRIGKDIYMGTHFHGEDLSSQITQLNSTVYPNYRWHQVDTAGHSDGTFCPVKPGLIVSLMDIPTYKDTFPNWEVVYLPGQSWEKVQPFIELKRKNKGKWWVPGEELNDDFTAFVEEWLSHWVGYVEETVFDVNMLVIDEKNVVCNNYNEDVFKAFDRHGITPHVINFRHRYFWDGGLHCITSDVHREGVMKDYFPERG